MTQLLRRVTSGNAKRAGVVSQCSSVKKWAKPGSKMGRVPVQRRLGGPKRQLPTLRNWGKPRSGKQLGSKQTQNESEHDQGRFADLRSGTARCGALVEAFILYAGSRRVFPVSDAAERAKPGSARLPAHAQRNSRQ